MGVCRARLLPPAGLSRQPSVVWAGLKCAGIGWSGDAKVSVSAGWCRLATYRLCGAKSRMKSA